VFSLVDITPAQLCPPPWSQSPDSGLGTRGIPTLAQMIRDSQQFSKPKLKRLSKEALLAWFAQSERLNIARILHPLRGHDSPILPSGSESIGHGRSSWSSSGNTANSSWRAARTKAAIMGGKPVSTGTRDLRVACGTIKTRIAGKNMARRACNLSTLRRSLHTRCLRDRRTGAMRRLHPEGQGRVDRGVAWRRVDESSLRQSDPVVSESLRIRWRRRHGHCLAAGVHRCAVVPRVGGQSEDRSSFA
jgi:hypothetical protein